MSNVKNFARRSRLETFRTITGPGILVFGDGECCVSTGSGNCCEEDHCLHR
jgi:hypothetical protein